MTFTTANCLRVFRGLPRRAGAAGLAAGLLAALGGVHAAPQALPAIAQSAAPVAVDPARTVPGALTVSRIDFKRGDAGAGQLTIRFSGDGAMPDMHPAGSRVVIDVANATLPPQLQKPLDVSDFATPVQRVDASRAGIGTRIVLETQGSVVPSAYQSGNDYVVEVAPRPVVASAAPAANGATASAAADRPYTGQPVTFNFQDVPVRTVLQLIAEEAKLNLVVSDSVGGSITLRLDNVPWDQALDIVLRAKSLDKRRSGNVMWVAPQAEIAKYERDVESARLASENNAEVVTEYLPISYGSAQDIARLLTEGSRGSGGGGGDAQGSRGFLSPRGSISFDQRTNTLLVIDIPQRVEGIKRLVAELDKPVDQVVIEARIVIANESFARELGAKFGVSGSKDNTYFSGDMDSNAANRNSDATADQAYATAYNAWLANDNRYDPVTNPNGVRPPLRPLSTITQGLMTNLPSALAGGTGSLALSILNAGYLLDVELSAMQTEGRGEIVSNPRIVTSNQKEALIRQGDQIGYVTTTGGQQGNLPNVQFKDAILQLKVTPTITADGRVFLNMDVQKDDLSGFVQTGVGQVPQLATRQVTTSVLVDDGQTVVIGGVYEFKDQQDLSKVPFLADLPVIGNLFKKRGRTKSKAELLIMVTPKVIRVARRGD